MQHVDLPFGEQGQSMVEVLVILPVMLLPIFGAIQFGLIYHAKSTLNYAAYEAVRAGTLNCDKKNHSACTSEVSQFQAIKEGFARGLAPLYSYHDRDGGDKVEAYQLARARVFHEFEDEKCLVRIERLSPLGPYFHDLAPDGVIANDNLMYRTEHSGQIPIQEANLLHLRFTYWYPLYVPLVNKLMFEKFICCKDPEGILPCRWAGDPVCQLDDPRIPLTATAAMRMQVPVENSPEFSGKGSCYK